MTRPTTPQSLNFLERLSIAVTAPDAEPPQDATFPDTLQRTELRAAMQRELGLDDAALARMYSPAFLTGAVPARTGRSTAARVEQAAMVIANYVPASHEAQLVLPLLLALIGDALRAGLAELLDLGDDHLPVAVIERCAMDAFAAELGPLCADTAIFELGLAARERLVSATDVEVLLTEANAVQTQPEYLDYLRDKYPVLLARLDARCALIVTALRTLFSRIATDRSALAMQLGLDPTRARVTAVTRGAGDSHNGADSVSFVEFEGAHTVVYKPRCMSPEAAFQRFLAWFNEVAPGLDQRLSWVLPRADYGWMEFVPARPCDTDADVHAYYRRYGALMALVNCVNGTDIHYQNLIANGAWPVVVDLETILQPVRLRTDGSEKHFLLDLEFYTAGPLYTAMVDPVFLESTLNSSPLALGKQREIPLKKIDWDATGALKFAPAGRVPSDSHCLRRGAELIDPYAHIDTLLLGYREASETLLCHRTLLHNELIPQLFGATTIRVIFKSTRKYCELLDALASAYAQEGFVQQDEYLTKLWVPVLSKPTLRKVVLAEKHDLIAGDVPYFSTAVDDCSVVDSRGLRIDAVLQESGLVTTLRKLARMSRATIERDLETLRYCLERKRREPTGNKENQTPEDEIAYGADPAKILGRLANVMLVLDGRLAFVDLIMGRDLATTHRPLGDDFYTGLPGVVFALAYGARELGDAALEARAKALAACFFDRYDIEATSQTGLCQGLGGAIYLAAHLYALWGNQLHLEIARQLAHRARAVAYSDRHFDLFSGTAGCALALRALIAVCPEPEVLQTLREACEHLLRHADRRDGVCTWTSSIPSDGPTTGFAHGVTGIAYALLCANELLNDVRISEVCTEVERFVQRMYEAEKDSWKEDAHSPGENRIEVWCHGAAGIALYYERAARDSDDAALRERAAQALRANLAHISFDNDSLCHGVLGNLDSALNLVGSGQPHPELDAARQAVAEYASGMATRKLACGNRYRHHSVSLFNGFAGMAYQLLRVRTPTLPSVLRFDPPGTYDAG